MGSSPSEPPADASGSGNTTLSGGSCEVELHQHVDSGVKKVFSGTGWHNVKDAPSSSDHIFGYNEATSYRANANKNCMIVGYTWHGGGKYHKDNTETGDAFMIIDGYHDLRSTQGIHPKTYNDNIDGLRIQYAPSGVAPEIGYTINIPAQVPHNFFFPKNIEDSNKRVKDDNGTLFDPCPGTDKKYFNSMPGVNCVYSDTDETQVQALHDAVGGGAKSNQAAMLTYVRGEFCKNSENAFKSVGGGETCMEHGAGQEIAMEYCGEGSRIIPENRGGDANCTSTTLDVDNYNQLAEKYCDANPGDSWCACYNVYKHANDGSFCDSNPTAAGCSKKVQSFDAMVNKVPSDQRAQFAGQDHCFGGVCGLNTYKPDKYRDPCSSQINVCIQDFTIESLVDTNFQAACVIDTGSGDGPSVDDQGQTGQSAGDIIAKENLNKAEQELADAEAAVAAGEPGAEERLAAAKKALGEAEADVLEPPSLTDFQNNPQAYFPQSIEGLKTDQRQQIGAGVMGAVALAFMMMMLLLVAGGGGGGGGAPVRRRRYR